MTDIAIVDYGMGNLYSVVSACRAVGVRAALTDDADAVAAAPGVIVPGVGAFGTAMAALEQRGLADAIRLVAGAGRPVLGVCLGMQLLLEESCEFGVHEGLGLVSGRVVPLPTEAVGTRRLKVPHVGWAPVRPIAPGIWAGTALEAFAPGAYAYFVHSYQVELADPGPARSTTPFGEGSFYSSLAVGNVFGCQFHPERSGPAGLAVYRSMFASPEPEVEDT